MVKSKPVKQEVSRTVKHPPLVSVCLNLQSVKERGHLNDLLAISSLQSKPSKLDLSSQSSPVMKVDLPNDSGVLKCFILKKLFFDGTATQQVILPQIGQGGDILLLHDSMIGIIDLTIFGILNGRGEN